MKLGVDSARSIEGALLIDKPAGPTSHDIVAFVRRTLKVDRAGHTGTLDPLATGLLIVLIGSATRLARFLTSDEKEYVADVRLGMATRTYDRASLDEALAEAGGRGAEVGKSSEEIEAVLARFRGTFLQTPPAYSAKKIASVPAYEKARKNQAVELKPVEVTVRALERLTPNEPRIPNLPTSNLHPPTSNLHPPSSNLHPPSSNLHPPTSAATLLRLRVAASSGFYVRSLAHDIGQALGCGAHLEALRRTRVGRFRVDGALTLDRLQSEGPTGLTSPSELLGHMPAVTLTNDAVRRVGHGNAIRGQTGVRPGSDGGQAGVGAGSDPGLTPVGWVRLLDADGSLLAVAEQRAGGLLQPVVVLR